MLAQPDRKFEAGPASRIALVVTIIAAYFSAFAAGVRRSNPEFWIALIVLGLIYYFFSVWPIKIFFRSRNRAAATALYFLFQLLLCGTIQYLGQGAFWLLFLPLTSQAASVLSRKALAVFCVLVMSLFLLPIQPLDWITSLQYGLLFSSALAFVLVFTEVSIHDQQARREVERLARELEEANRRLRESAAQAEELARSRERNRLAREIHDSVGHYLTVINVQLEAAKALVESRGWKDSAPDLYSTLEKAQNLAHNGLEDVRRSVAALRANPIVERPFLDALKGLIAECQEAGLVANLRVDGQAAALPPSVELALYRTAQEALTNVRKHARASRVDVQLTYGAKAVRIAISDNGVGMPAEDSAADKFGLLGLRERAELLHGELEVGAAPDGGVRLTMELPIT